MLLNSRPNIPYHTSPFTTAIRAVYEAPIISKCMEHRQSYVPAIELVVLEAISNLLILINSSCNIFVYFTLSTHFKIFITKLFMTRKVKRGGGRAANGIGGGGATSGCGDLDNDDDDDLQRAMCTNQTQLCVNNYSSKVHSEGVASTICGGVAGVGSTDGGSPREEATPLGDAADGLLESDVAGKDNDQITQVGGARFCGDVFVRLERSYFRF